MATHVAFDTGITSIVFYFLEKRKIYHQVGLSIYHVEYSYPFFNKEFYKMKIVKTPAILFFVLAIILFSCKPVEKKETASKYFPDSKALYDSIVQMDSILFTAYNNCDTITFASLVSADLEFYHDKGGLMTSKDSLMIAIKNNICGKVTRELVKGSIEVYRISGYGAVEMGEHFFHTNREPEPAEHKIGKFVQLWENENGSWKLTRVISLH